MSLSRAALMESLRWEPFITGWLHERFNDVLPDPLEVQEYHLSAEPPKGPAHDSHDRRDLLLLVQDECLLWCLIESKGVEEIDPGPRMKEQVTTMGSARIADLMVSLTRSEAIYSSRPRGSVPAEVRLMISVPEGEIAGENPLVLPRGSDRHPQDQKYLPRLLAFATVLVGLGTSRPGGPYGP